MHGNMNVKFRDNQFETKRRISLECNWIYNLPSVIGTLLILKDTEEKFLIANVCICVSFLQIYS